MKEFELRDLISSNIEKLKSGLALLQKEQYIPNYLGTRSFIDLYAKDALGNHVLIEVKKSDVSSRQALHEVTKYVESVKHHFAVKDTEIYVIIASTEWKELQMPFSRFANDMTFSVEGYKILLSGDYSQFWVEPMQPLPTSQGRLIAPWHNMYWYTDIEALNQGINSIEKAYKEKAIKNYVVVKLYVKNKMSQEERLSAMRASISQVLKIDESEISQLPEVPVHEYIAYVGIQMLTKDYCMKILSCDTDAIIEALELLPNMEEEEALCYLHECIETIRPQPQSDYFEIGYPAKFGKLLDSPNCEICDIVRHGSFLRNSLLSDETIISELCGEDGITGQKFKQRISINNQAHVKVLKENISFTLSKNPIWKAHILKIIDEIREEFLDSEIDISIFNPCTGIFTIYYATTKEDGILYIPTYHIVVYNPNEVRIYFGALEEAGSALSFPELLKKYYDGDLEELLFSITWGGKDERDSDIVEDLGIQYRSFRYDLDDKNVFFKLHDSKWKICKPTDMYTLFIEYLNSNKKLIHQIKTKIQPRDMGAFFDPSSASLSLDEYIDMELAKHKNCYFSGAPDECDICKCSFDGEKYMIDGGIHNHTAWACMCADCFNAFGEGIALGKGQLYMRDKKGWLLVNGIAEDFKA